MTWVTDVVVSRVNGDYGIAFWGEEPRLRVLVNAEGNSADGGQDFLVTGRGAAHSNTQGDRDKSGDNSLGCRESTDNRGVRQKK